MAEPDAAEIVQWMLEELQDKEYLYQSAVVHELQTRFDGRFIYTNANGNPSIDRQVLHKFRAESAGIWSRSEYRWRKRGPEDPPDLRFEA